MRKPKPRRMRLAASANAIRLTFSEHEYEMDISALAQVPNVVAAAGSISRRMGFLPSLSGAHMAE